MKNSSAYIIIYVVSIFFTVICNNVYAKESLENDLLINTILEWDEITIKKDLHIKYIKKIHSKGKIIIPDLIKKIDFRNEVVLHLFDPLSSKICISLSLDEYIGVFYAYLIELILKKDDIFTPLTYSPHSTEYNYGSGIIFCCCRIAPRNLNADCSTSLVDLTYRDIMKIKQVYTEWWANNKDKSLEELREDYKNGIRPLTNSDYEWF